MAGVDQVSKLLTAGGTSALSAVSPWTLAAGLPAEAFKLGKGIADRALANKIDRRTQRPMFQIPGAAIEGLNLQRNLAAGQSPGLSQAQNLMAQSQAGNTAAILNSGGSSGERMAALMGQNQIANQGALQLGAQQENWAAAQNQNLINQLGQFEDWQQKKWNWDIQQPYEQAKAKAAELRGDASQNIYGALRGIGGQAAATIRTGGEDASTLGQVTESPSLRGIQPEAPTPTGAFDPSKVAGQGEGPMNGLSGRDAMISDPDGLIQDPDGLINKKSVSPAAMEADKRLAAEKSAFFRSNPDAVVSKYAPLFRGISKYITGGI